MSRWGNCWRGGSGGGGRDGTGSGGSDDGLFSLTEQPLDGLAIGAVTQFASELKYTSGDECRHSDTAATAVHLGVTVSSARDGELSLGCVGGGSGGGTHWLGGVLF